MTKKLLGVRINPHLFRSSAATGLVEQSPQDWQAAAPLLGHTSFRTTQRAYLIPDSACCNQTNKYAARENPRPEAEGATIDARRDLRPLLHGLQREASIEDQVRLCRERPSARLDGVPTFADRALSGASMLRPGLQGLLEDAWRGGSTSCSPKRSTA